MVDDIRVVAPEDVGQLAPTSDDVLTLVTCYPFRRSPRSPQRYIVRALPIGPSRSTRLSPLQPIIPASAMFSIPSAMVFSKQSSSKVGSGPPVQFRSLALSDQM